MYKTRCNLPKSQKQENDWQEWLSGAKGAQDQHQEEVPPEFPRAPKEAWCLNWHEENVVLHTTRKETTYQEKYWISKNAWRYTELYPDVCEWQEEGRDDGWWKYTDDGSDAWWVMIMMTLQMAPWWIRCWWNFNEMIIAYCTRLCLNASFNISDNADEVTVILCID